MIKGKKTIAFISIVLLLGLFYLAYSLLEDDVTVFTGERKHWKAQLEVTKRTDDYGTNGSFQLSFKGEKLPVSQVEYKLFTSDDSSSKFGGSHKLDSSKEIGTFRSYYDFEDIQNSMVTVVIKWDNFEERIELAK